MRKIAGRYGAKIEAFGKGLRFRLGLLSVYKPTKGG
jgi:hypothetical protein